MGEVEDQTAMELFAQAETEPVAVSRKAWQQPMQMVLRKQSMSATEKRNFMSMVTQKTWVIDPRTAKWMLWWDIAMVLALAFTAIITPYQIAFLEPPMVLSDGIDGLWLVNRITDVFFVTDVAIVCNTMYQEPLVDGGMWISRRSLIVKKYLNSGWLLVDAVSCFPYFLIGLALEASSGGDANGKSLMPLRLVKLVRMLKLTRCLKAAAKVGPYMQEVVMGYMEMTYAKLQVALLFLYLVFYTHLQACFWALLSSLTENGGGYSTDDPRPTWLSAQREAHLAQWGVEPTPWDTYCAALYWSGMTITSIGYGEMLPVNTDERVICTLLMLISGMVWTFILSTAAGIAATLDPNKVLFQTTMDQLNFFMRERSLPRGMRRELREFFEQARRVREVNDDASLLASMSPLLQGTVAFAANRQWLRKIWWLQKMSDSRESREFIANLAKSLAVNACARRPPCRPRRVGRARRGPPPPRPPRPHAPPHRLASPRHALGSRSLSPRARAATWRRSGRRSASSTCCVRACASRTGASCARGACGATT